MAQTILLEIEADGDPVMAIDPDCVAAAAAHQHAAHDGAWAMSPAAVEGHLKQITASVGHLPEVAVENAGFDDYGLGYASFAELLLTARDGSLRRSRTDGGVEVEGMLLLLCRLAPLACLISGCLRSRSPNGSGSRSMPSRDAVVRPLSPGWEQTAHYQIAEVLTAHGFSLLEPQTLSREIDRDLRVDTNLGDPPYTVFDAWFHWID